MKQCLWIGIEGMDVCKESRGLLVTKTGDGKELIVLLSLCLFESLDERALEGGVFVQHWGSQNKIFDLASGDIVEGCLDRGMTSGKLGLDLGKPRGGMGHPESGQLEGHGIDGGLRFIPLEGLCNGLDISGIK